MGDARVLEHRALFQSLREEHAAARGVALARVSYLFRHLRARAEALEEPRGFSRLGALDRGQAEARADLGRLGGAQGPAAAAARGLRARFGAGATSSSLEDDEADGARARLVGAFFGWTAWPSGTGPLFAPPRNDWMGVPSGR